MTNEMKLPVALNVKNLERSVHIYRTLFGTDPCKVETGIRQV